MQVHIFKSKGDLYGFTAQPSGGNLPADKGPWALFKSVEIFKEYPAPRIGVDEADVLTAIESQGFYLTNAQIEVGRPPEE